MWEEPAIGRFMDRLSSFSRLILFDKRGTGLSDRVADADLPGLEVRMDDARAVMDAVGSERATLFGISEGSALCALFAATYPMRTTALIMAGGYPRRTKTPDFPWAPTPEQMDGFIEQMQRDWGGPVGLEVRAPSMLHDERFRGWWAHFLRSGASRSGVATLMRMNAEIDVRSVLPAIRVPTLILHSANDRAVDIGNSRYMAEVIPGAKLVESRSRAGRRPAHLERQEQDVTAQRIRHSPLHRRCGCHRQSCCHG